MSNKMNQIHEIHKGKSVVIRFYQINNRWPKVKEFIREMGGMNNNKVSELLK